MAPQTNPTVVPMSTPSANSPRVIIIVVVLIIAAVLIAVWLRKGSVGPSLNSDQGGEAGALSEEEKRELLGASTAPAAPLSDAEKQKLLNSANSTSGSSKPLTEAEKQKLLESANQ